MISRTEKFYNLVALATILLLGIPVTIACIYLGMGLGDNPCILCWQERIVMMLIGLVCLFIMRYGLRPKYLALLIFYCALGIFFSLRHTATHFLRDIGQGFAMDIFGVHTYTWGVFIYWLSLFFLALILGFFTNGIVDNEDGDIRFLSKLQKVSFLIFFFTMSANAIQAFTQVGPPPFLGQSDPIRFSWQPSRWVWSMKKWNNLLRPFSLRGNYSIESPSFSSRNMRKIAMFESGDDLIKVQELSLPDEIVGEIKDIDYNADAKIFAIITDRFYLYILDSKLNKIISFVKIDNLFRLHIKTFVGVTFSSSHNILITGFNKSYIILELDEKAKLKDQYDKFILGTNGIRELHRGRFSTIRAKYSYVRSVTWDSSQKEYVTLTIPNSKNKKVVASHFSGLDLILNSENEVFINDTITLPAISSLKLFNGVFYGLNPVTKEILISDNKLAGFTGSIKLPANADYKGFSILQENQFVIINNKTAIFYVK